MRTSEYMLRKRERERIEEWQGVDEREREVRGEKSVEIGRWNLHTSYDLREDVKHFQRAASFTGRLGGGKKLHNAATKCSKILDDSNGRVVALY